MKTDTIDHLIPHIRHAVRISQEHVTEGGIPFSGLVVRNGRVLGTGFNQVRETNDATAHAEIVALRNAAKKAGRFGTAGSTLIASGEPCALCYMAALHFNVEHIVFATGRETAAAYGFDHGGSYAIETGPDAHRRRRPYLSSNEFSNGTPLTSMMYRTMRHTAGSRSTKRAPPVAESPTSSIPEWAWAISREIVRPRPAPRPSSS
ncbi:hypothetical protein GCM10010191_46750 [Actinomadura vinacea]|uniref:CMP/dCMP-type deaminase domain-containing protein n=1 Tax=Actinomadura vinacea TaxID=115336 RepID=A0ABN3JER0_9ACTN